MYLYIVGCWGWWFSTSPTWPMNSEEWLWVLQNLATNIQQAAFFLGSSPLSKFQHPILLGHPALSVGEEDTSCTGQAASWTLPWWLEPVSRCRYRLPWPRVTKRCIEMGTLWPMPMNQSFVIIFQSWGVSFGTDVDVVQFPWLAFKQVDQEISLRQPSVISPLQDYWKSSSWLLLTWDNLFWCLWPTYLLSHFWTTVFFLGYHPWVCHLEGPASATSFSSWQMRFRFYFEMITYLYMYIYIYTWTWTP